jgi:spore germination cell wall hydrolase CwlJ-like protein
MNKLGLILACAMSAFALTGCTTSGSSLDAPASSFAAVPDPSIAPIPVAKPDSTEDRSNLAEASLAASVENDAEEAVTQKAATAVSFAPEANTQKPNPLAKPATKDLRKAKAIPDDAVEVASAKSVTEAPVKRSMRDRDCLMRAMYFESNRSSRDGQLAVGTVVMHRLAAGTWGKSVCGVVSAHRQFAPGVMSRSMQGNTSDLASLADAILAGKRHPGVAKNVLFFHTAGMKFPYKNMRYVLVAGGNTFYYKARRRG